MFAARLRTVRPRFAAVRAFAASAAPCEEKTLGESAKDAAEGVAKKFQKTGSVGSKFEKGGDVAETAEKVGGPFSSDGAVGKQFTSDGAVGGTGQKAAEAAEDESRASKNKPI